MSEIKYDQIFLTIHKDELTLSDLDDIWRKSDYATLKREWQDLRLFYGNTFGPCFYVVGDKLK